MRLFFATTLSEPLVQLLHHSQERLIRSIPDGLTITNLSQLHLTLLFLGERPEDELPKWVDLLREMASKISTPFKIKTTAWGAFPTSQDPRVIWAGITEETGSMLKMVNDLREGARALGCNVEDRPFAPHLTLARNKRARNATALRLFLGREKLPEYSEVVQKIVLFESSPLNGSHKYTEIASALVG